MNRCWSIEPEDLEAHPYTLFLKAVRAGDLRKVREFVSTGVGLKHPGAPLPPTTPPLIEAVKHTHEAVCTELLNIVEDLDEQDVEEGGTALHWAAALGCLSVAEQLIKKKANIQAVNWYGRTPLHQAAQSGHKAVLQVLLQQGADVSASSTETGATALHLAAAKGSSPCVEVLLSFHAPIDARDTAGFTPLLMAAKSGHLLVLQVLLRHGASATLVDYDAKRTCVHWAAFNGHKSIVHQLLSDKVFEVDVKDELQETLLLLTARRGHSSLVKDLLELGANVDARNARGVTPLMNAAFFGHQDIVQMLLSRGCDVTPCDAKQRRTALHWAAANEHAPVVSTLLDYGANPTRVDKDGLSPLDLAVESDASAIVLMLQRALEGWADSTMKE